MLILKCVALYKYGDAVVFDMERSQIKGLISDEGCKCWQENGIDREALFFSFKFIMAIFFLVINISGHARYYSLFRSRQA